MYPDEWFGSSLSRVGGIDVVVLACHALAASVLILGRVGSIDCAAWVWAALALVVIGHGQESC